MEFKSQLEYEYQSAEWPIRVNQLNFVFVNIIAKEHMTSFTSGPGE